MKFDIGLTDQTILVNLGERLAQLRLSRGLTQAGLAKAAGVAKRTVERVEAGESIQLLTLVRLCRVLDLLDGLAQLVPVHEVSPMALLKDKSGQKTPQRARARKNKQGLKTETDSTWRWGDDA